MPKVGYGIPTLSNSAKEKKLVTTSSVSTENREKLEGFSTTPTIVFLNPLGDDRETGLFVMKIWISSTVTQSPLLKY